MFYLVLFSIFLPPVILLVGFYYRFLKTKNYWKDKNIPNKEPEFLVGNFKEAGKKNLGIIFRELYEEARGVKVFGLWQFTIPVLLIVDLEMVKRVLVTDFSHFDDHGVYYDEKTDPLAVNLLTLGGAAWRNVRTKLNPAFTAGKLKLMFPMVLKCGEELKNVLKDFAVREDVVEFKDLLARYTTDVISICAFGIDTNSLKYEDAIFRKMGKEVFEPTWEVLVRNFAGFLFPNFARFFKIPIYPRKVTEFFIKVIHEVMTHRENNNIKRNDILQMLIQLKNEGFILPDNDAKYKEETSTQKEKNDKFTYEQAAAQAFIFFTAGFETSSTTSQYALYELAMNPDIQDKLRSEIHRVLAENDGKLTYELVHKMEYLSQVVSEVLRKYPPATNINRVCTKDYKLPDTDTIIDKGTQITISVYGLHMDDRFYPHPEKFDPDRFTKEQKATRPVSAYIPFGDGPRTCIGQKFGLTQTKVGLISIISNYQVSISEKHTKIPPVYDPKSFFSAPQGGMHLKISLLDS